MKSEMELSQTFQVGAGAVVTKDVPEETVAFGSPAKVHGGVRSILNKDGLPAYPWREHFDRGMPWTGVGYEVWSKQQVDGVPPER